MKAAFKQADVERAIRAVKSGGESVAAVDVRADGGFRVWTMPPVGPADFANAGAGDDLDAELEAWSQRHGHG